MFQMFQKGDELVPKVSREISNLRTNGKLNEMANGWLEIQLPYTTDDTSNPITFDRFRGVFMITGVSSAFALGVLLIHWLRDRWEYVVNLVNILLLQRLVHLRNLFANIIHLISPLADPIGEHAVQTAQSNIQ